MFLHTACSPVPSDWSVVPWVNWFSVVRREMEVSRTPLSEAEFEEIMNRNRAISSSAISRAVSDASAGERNLR